MLTAEPFSAGAPTMRYLFLSMILALAVPTAWAAEGSADVIGRVKMVRGDAFIQRATGQVAAEPGTTLTGSDVLVTGSNGQLGVTFADNSRFALGPNTEIELQTFSFNTTTHEGQFESNIKRGRLSVISGRIAKSSPDAMTVRTPSQILGVRGTEFLVRVSP
ncbi:MAG: hypothetical protein ACI8PT_000709 [Gammaproteobacteria bacterium]|jgi:hypothetical protein